MDNKKKLSFLIKRSNLLYQQYLNKPIYINALSIKSVNSAIIDFLIQNGYLFNNEEAVNNVITHYEGWYFQFLEYERQGFDLSSKFIFKRLDDVLPYPKEFIEIILK